MHFEFYEFCLLLIGNLSLKMNKIQLRLCLCIEYQYFNNVFLSFKRTMDLVAPNASKEYAIQTAKWCVQNKETEALRAVLDTNFNESNLSEFDNECTEILYKSITLVDNKPLEMLLKHVDESFLKQTFGNDKKTLVTKLLCSAIETGQANKIQDLVIRGADVNFFYQGKPLLHLALELGYMDAVKELADAGGSLYLLDRRGNGPLVALIQSTVQNKVIYNPRTIKTYTNTTNN